MAHEIEIINGKASFFSARGLSAWHRLGTIVDSVKTAAEAIELAGLNWSVAMEKAFTSDGQEIAGVRVTRRTTDGAILGCVGDRYRPLQNSEAFAFFDPFVASGECSYETAGSLHGGSRIWVLARINRDPIVIGGKDQIDKYLLISNGHDGKIAVRVGETLVRAVCANTLALAHNDKASQLVRVRHSSKTVATLSDIRQTMDTIDGGFKATADVYSRLAQSAINKKDLQKYVCRVFNTPEDEPPRAMANILNNFDHGLGADVAGPTMWGAYQAMTDYFSWEQGRSAENRLDSNAYGVNAQVNQKALDLAYNYVTVGGF
jgi:phage/plasmid-like protein (TIGR03299 family)